MAQGPRSSPFGSPAYRCRYQRHFHSFRQWRRHRAGRRSGGHRLGRNFRALCRPRACEAFETQCQGSGHGGHAHRQRDLHFHQRQLYSRRALGAGCENIERFSRIKGIEQLMTTKSEKELIYAPGGNGAEPVEGQELLPALDDMTPREIVAELDKYIVGQNAAKRAVAVALRNRVRRQKLPPEIAEDVLPKNILMIGPTGVGKTEIARRLARLAGCPFVKVEASKYTEVGYVGRDVESMVRDLVETSIDMIREEKLDEVADRAEQAAEGRVLDLLLPPSPAPAAA